MKDLKKKTKEIIGVFIYLFFAIESVSRLCSSALAQIQSTSSITPVFYSSWWIRTGEGKWEMAIGWDRTILVSTRVRDRLWMRITLTQGMTVATSTPMATMQVCIAYDFLVNNFEAIVNVFALPFWGKPNFVCATCPITLPLKSYRTPPGFSIFFHTYLYCNIELVQKHFRYPRISFDANVEQKYFACKASKHFWWLLHFKGRNKNRMRLLKSAEKLWLVLPQDAVPVRLLRIRSLETTIVLIKLAIPT